MRGHIGEPSGMHTLTNPKCKTLNLEPKPGFSRLFILLDCIVSLPRTNSLTSSDLEAHALPIVRV